MHTSDMHVRTKLSTSDLESDGKFCTQAAAALGVEVDNEDDDDDDCKPTVTAAAIAAADPQIQNGLDYFK